jgi:hypothetical protein
MNSVNVLTSQLAVDSLCLLQFVIDVMMQALPIFMSKFSYP